MRKISLWAKNNKWTTRFFIVAIYILLNTLGIVSGWLLDDLNVSIPFGIFLLFVLLFLSGVVAYPNKKNKEKNYSSFYTRQKTCDAILAFSTFLMIVFAGNNFQSILIKYPSLNAAVFTSISIQADSSIKSYKSLPAFTESMRDANGKTLSWKEKKKLLKKQIRGIESAKDLSDGKKTWMIILSIIIALGLLFLLAALSCGIGCGGAEVLAGLVAIVGTALIIFFLVRTIKRISREKGKVEPIKENTKTDG